MAELVLYLVDVTRGQPIDNVEVDVQKTVDGVWHPVNQLVSDKKGKVTIIRNDQTDDPSGYYEATVALGSYFLQKGYVLPTLKFVDLLPIRFGISDINQISRVIVSVTPFGYSLTMA